MDALGTYISFATFTGQDVGINLQNFHANEFRQYEGRSYAYSGFGYSGATYELQAANTEAVLVFANNDMSQSFIEQAVEDRWIVRVKTVWLDPDSYQETSRRVEEVYAVVAWTTDLTQFRCQLSSPLNAQDEELPARVLSQRIVGSLPPKGSIALA